MAEILIQRRRHRNIWPWLLGLVALALLPLPFLAADRDDRTSSRRSAATRRDTTAGRDTTAPRDTAVAGGAVVAPGGPARGGAPGGAPGGPSRGASVGAGGAASGAPERVAGAPQAAAARTTATASGSVAAPGAAPVSRPSGGSAPTPVPAGAAPAGAPAPAPTPAPAATTFERFIAAPPRNAGDPEQRLYTADALRRLADELRALGASRTGVRRIVANADSLRMSGSRQTPHPDYARAAFLAAVREMDVLRARYRAPVDTGALRAAAWAVRPDRRFAQQRGTVQTFFERARDALHVLSRAARTRRSTDVRAR